MNREVKQWCKNIFEVSWTDKDGVRHKKMLQTIDHVPRGHAVVLGWIQ